MIFLEASHSGLVPATAGLESIMIFFVYILQSMKDNRYYIGYTENLEKRMVFHNKGLNTSTKYRRPLKLIYSEKFITKKEALRREKEIKSYKGGNAFKKLIFGGVA